VLEVGASGLVRVGISGRRYKGWRGFSYPPNLPRNEQLAYAASVFPTIEVNGTFYSLQQLESFARWASQTPEAFVFVVKESRYYALRISRIASSGCKKGKAEIRKSESSALTLRH
jgi:uncharacterized protein YecE (DUF72 family)